MAVTPLEHALYEAAKLLYAYERETESPEENTFRQSLDRCAEQAGYTDLDALYEYILQEYQDQADMMAGIL